jgi:hypothetical protein
MDFTRCSQESRDRFIVVTEQKRVFRIDNSSNEYIRRITIDGCLIDDQRIRCDYAFELGEDSNRVVYLELKGSDIEYALSQLVATMGYLAARHREKRKICHIVASRVPRAGPKVQNLKLQMSRKQKALLYVGTQEVTIHLNKEPYRG